MDTDKASAAIQEIVDNLHELANNFFDFSLALMEESSEAPAPAGSPPAPAPTNAPTPTGTPANQPPASSQLSSLIDSAMAEALILKKAGHNVESVISRIERIKTSPAENVQTAIGEAQLLKEDHGIETLSLVLILMQISTLVGAGGGVTEGDTDRPTDFAG